MDFGGAGFIEDVRLRRLLFPRLDERHAFSIGKFEHQGVHFKWNKAEDTKGNFSMEVSDITSTGHMRPISSSDVHDRPIRERSDRTFLDLSQGLRARFREGCSSTSTATNHS